MEVIYHSHTGCWELLLNTFLLKMNMIDIRNFIILYLICMLFGCLYFGEMY